MWGQLPQCVFPSSLSPELDLDDKKLDFRRSHTWMGSLRLPVRDPFVKIIGNRDFSTIWKSSTLPPSTPPTLPSSRWTHYPSSPMALQPHSCRHVILPSCSRFHYSCMFVNIPSMHEHAPLAVWTLLSLLHGVSFQPSTTIRRQGVFTSGYLSSI